jgi:alkylation response protein AidB-like acyl-CoA dehydrogenase
MDYALTPDQRMFAQTTRDFLGKSCPTSVLRAKRDDPAGFDSKFWRQGAELGWTSLLVSEEDGGGSISERGLVDLTLIAHEFGRFAAPGPLTATNVVTLALSEFGTAEQRDEALPGLLSGERIATWAFAEPKPFAGFGTVSLQAVRDGDGYRLSGHKAPVEAAGQADLLLVTAREGDGLTQFLVPVATAGVSVRPMSTLDLTRRYGHVTFDQVQVPLTAVVGSPGEAAADVERQLQVAITLQLAEMVGCMDRALEMTLEWLFSRYSFGRPLASYQELKHRFVDMRSWLEAGNAIADAAALQVQGKTTEAAEYVSAGKSYLGQFGPEALQDCIQMFGGIGVTFEHDLHIFLRRVVLDAQTYGSVTDHRERLATILEQREPIDA